MAKTNHALYQVTLKILLKYNDKYLTLFTNDGFVDFPGGRVDETEYDIPFVKSMQRELSEELNSSSIAIGDLAFICKRAYTFTGTTHHVLAIYYNATLREDNISLSDEHAHYKWLSAKEILAHKPEQFVSHDEYEQLTTYFSKLNA